MLVTLGIIGVVSAMTVPTLMQNHQRKTYVAQLHKVYTELQQAFIQYMNDHNAVNLSEAGLTAANANSAKDFLHTYFKVITDCSDGYHPCFSDDYRSLDGTKTDSLDDKLSGNGHCSVIASGVSICIFPIALQNDNDLELSLGKILVDTNGVQGPNIGGRDTHFFRFYADGTVDIWRGKCDLSDKACLQELRDKRFDDEATCKSSPVGDDCIGKLLNDNWEMSY